MTNCESELVELINDDHRLIVRSRVPLPELAVGEKRKTVVVLGDTPYWVAKHHASPKDRLYLYELSLFRAGYEIPGRRLLFASQESFVSELEEKHRPQRSQWLVPALLYPAFPVAGFLPLRCKELLEERMGWAIHRHTFVSIVVEVGVIITLGAVTSVIDMSRAYMSVLVGTESELIVAGWMRNAGYIATLVLVIDTVMRVHYYLEQKYLGFLEWFWRLFSKPAP